jgi:hypothetical protein
MILLVFFVVFVQENKTAHTAWQGLLRNFGDGQSQRAPLFQLDWMQAKESGRERQADPRKSRLLHELRQAGISSRKKSRRG